jgi:predicted phosphoribosyltransferase
VPLDVFLMEPVLAPGREATLGSVGWPPSHQLHEATVNAMRLVDEDVRHAMALARHRLRQRLHALRPLAPPPALEGRTVLLVDEGVGQGLRLLDAAGLARRAGAHSLVAAVPVGSGEGLRLLASEFDDVVCPWEAETFDALSLFYKDFPAVPDAEVRDALARAWRRESPRPEAAAP